MADEDWDDWGEETANPQEPIEASSDGGYCYSPDELVVQKVLFALREYQKDLADQVVLDKINRKLSAIAFDQFMSYYNENKKLSSYTIDTELKRMKFHVIYEGCSYKDEAGIVGIYEKTSLHDIWRLANQSLYADLLLALQQSLLRPELCISVVSTESSFILNMDRNTLVSQSSFRVMTVSGSGSGSGAAAESESGVRVGAVDKATESGRLEMSSLCGEVSIDFNRRSVLQRVHSPALRMVFDTALRQAAEAIARQQSCQREEEEEAGGYSPSTRSFKESIGDIRARLINQARSEATRESLKATVKVVQKAGGSLFSGVLEGVVWGIGSMVGAGAGSKENEISFRPSLSAPSTCDVPAIPTHTSTPTQSSSSCSTPTTTATVAATVVAKDTKTVTSAHMPTNNDDEDNSKGGDVDDDWDWNEDEKAIPSHARASSTSPPSSSSSSSTSQLDDNNHTTTSQLSAATPATDARWNKQATLKLGSMFAEKVVLGLGTLLGAKSSDDLSSSSSPVKFYRSPDAATAVSSLPPGDVGQSVEIIKENEGDSEGIFMHTEQGGADSSLVYSLTDMTPVAVLADSWEPDISICDEDDAENENENAAERSETIDASEIASTATVVDTSTSIVVGETTLEARITEANASSCDTEASLEEMATGATMSASSANDSSSSDSACEGGANVSESSCTAIKESFVEPTSTETSLEITRAVESQCLPTTAVVVSYDDKSAPATPMPSLDSSREISSGPSPIIDLPPVVVDSDTCIYPEELLADKLIDASSSSTSNTITSSVNTDVPALMSDVPTSITPTTADAPATIKAAPKDGEAVKLRTRGNKFKK